MMGKASRTRGLALGLASAALWACGQDPQTSRQDPPPPPPLLPEAVALREGGALLLARTEQIRARAETFDARAALARLGENESNGPVLRLDDRLEEATIEAPAAATSRDDESEGLAFEFEGADAFTLAPTAGESSLRDGALELRHTRDAYLISREPLSLAREAIGEIELRMRVVRSTRAELGWSTEAPGERPTAWVPLLESSGVISVDLVPDGRFHLYRIDATVALRRGAREGPLLRSVFLRASNIDDEPVAIDFLRFVPRRTRYAARPAGTAYEVRAGEMRPVLHVATPSTLTYTLRVPERAPRLDFGLSVLDAGSPVRFVVRADDGPELFSASVDGPDAWSDASVPLDAFAGRRVRLSLRTEGAEGNVAFWSSPRVSGAPRRRLRVIVLLEDALRADALSAYGNARSTSPHHDALAARGVLFERAFAQATKTRPSCPSFMTSLLPGATGVWDHHGHLGDAYLTLAEVLRSQGFTTASFLQNSNAGPAAGLHQGFDQVFEPSLMGEGPEIFDAAQRWLRDHADRNVFAYVHVIDPHGIYDPPPPFDAWYRADGPGTTPVAPDRRLFDPAWVEAPTAEGRRLLYHGEVRHNDELLGGFLDALASQGLLDDALVVSIADHGEHLGEDGRWGHNPPGTPGVLRVPLVLVHPTLPAGRRIRAPVQLLDLMPTLLEMAGIDPSGLLLQGDSLVGWMRGDAPAEPIRRRVIVSEEPTLFGDRARPRRSGSVIRGDTQVLRTAAAGAARIIPEPADPVLRGQLEAESDALLDALQAADREIWRALHRGERDEVRLDPAAQEQLRALGYLE